MRKIVVDIARGDLPAARAVLDRFLRNWQAWRTSSLWGERFIEIVEPLKEPLLANDIAGLARILHDWEADAVKNTKLDKVWEKTPFPLERLLDEAIAASGQRG